MRLDRVLGVGLMIALGGGACSGDDASGAAAACDDGARNGVETGVDCGGADCDPCALAQGCVAGDDCTSGVCQGQLCVCTDGYADDGAGACANVDECTLGLDDCAANATCTDADGGFTCVCAAGFSGDGATCTACADGTYGVACAETCVAADCASGVRCDGVTGAVTGCAGCAAGRWGATCSDTCAQGDCTGTVTCDQTTGAPVSCAGCAAGAYGATCSETCAQGDCSGTVTCDQTSGVATSCTGCEPGAYGATCSETCAQGVCTGAVTCDQATGAATSCTSCEPGSHGATCSDTCAQGDCTGTVTCDQTTGAAVSCAGCEAGSYGATCSETCAQGDCTGTVTCDQTTGAPIGCAGCGPGFYGAACDMACAQGDCTGTVTCDQTTGAAMSCTGCEAGRYGATCSETCAQGDCTGTVTCDQTTGAAISCTGCTPGSHGATCSETCAQGDCTATVTCDQTTGAAVSCAGCAPGAFGTTCSDSCAQGDCTGTVTCDQTTGAAVNCTGCEPGAYGATCSDSCAQGDCTGAVTCDQTSGAAVSCTGCEPGTYGTTCGDSCAQGDCAGTVTCDQTTGAALGCAACEPGFYGAACDMACAQGDCVGTVTCDQTTGASVSCTGCEPGSYGATCSDTCAQGDCTGTVTCDQTTGAAISCTGCEPGSYGATCLDSCAQGDCTGAVTCDQTTGAAVSCTGCTPGSHGTTCGDSCAQGDCTGAVTCDQTTGAATSCTGCEAGSYGTTCTVSCDDPGSCVGTITCDQTTGAATSCTGCEPGAYGITCGDSCAQGDCTGTVTCDQTTGAAISCMGCEPGSYGTTCGDSCAQGDCTGTVTCEQTTGAAVSCTGCDPGSYGTTCADSCADPGDCVGTVTCDQTTGTATSCTSCEPGFHGATCTDSCADPGNCIGTVTCDQTTGAAIRCSGCDPGFYGITCGDSCVDPGNCAGTVTCNKTTGAATSCASCDDGFYDAVCSTACPAGTCTAATACDQTTGAATSCDGCAEGYWGTLCTNTCSQPNCTQVQCDAVTGATTACTACAEGFVGDLCETDWWDRHWVHRVPLDITLNGVPDGADHAQVQLDVGEVCYGFALPPVLYSFHFSDDALSHIDSGDGFGVFAPLEHGGTFTRGVEGGGLRLNGTDDWVDLPDITPRSGRLTVSSWVKLDRLPSDSPAILSAWKDGEVYELRVTGEPASVCNNDAAGGGVRLMGQVHPQSQGEPNLCSVTQLEADRWYFATLTYDGQTAALYLDGELEVTHTFPVPAPLTFATDLRLGVERGLTDFLPGVVDDVQLLDGALDATQVAALMSPGCRRDLGDVRVYDRTTLSLLPHWVDSDRSVWVRVPVTAEPHAFDLYFGNPDAPDSSDGHAVFELFDDFADGIDAAAWMTGSLCAATSLAGLNGRVRSTADCDTLTSLDTFGDTPLSALVSVYKQGTTAFSCNDVSLEWLGPHVSGTVRFDFDGVDGVGVGRNEAFPESPVCGDQATMLAAAANQGLLFLAEPPAGGTYHATYLTQHFAGVSSAPFAAAGAKGSLRLHLVGDAGSPRWIDNLRVVIPTDATVSAGSRAECAVTESVECCADSDCGGGFYCGADATCVRELQWTNLGLLVEQLVIASFCTSTLTTNADCTAEVLGERVYITPQSQAPPSRTIGIRLLGSISFMGSNAGGAGYSSVLSADATNLTWSGGQSCGGQATYTLDPTAHFECQAKPPGTTQFDFQDNASPLGWAFQGVNGGSIRNERLEAQATDQQAGLQMMLDPTLPAPRRIDLSFVGEIKSSQWGSLNYVAFSSPTAAFTVRNQSETHQHSNPFAAVRFPGEGESDPHRVVYPATFPTFRYEVSYIADNVWFRMTNMSTGEVVADIYRFGAPMDVSEVDSILLRAIHNTGSGDTWMDDVRLEIYR